MEHIQWDDVYTSGKQYSLMPEELVDLIIQKAKPPKNVLDIGCGTGSLLRSFAKRNLKVAGVDISAVALKKAKSVLEDAKADFSLIQLDLNDPYFSDKYTESFDIVVTHLVIAFIPNRDIFLKNIGNLLSKNGVYICSTPVLLKNRSYNDHQTRISLEEKRSGRPAQKKFCIGFPS